MATLKATSSPFWRGQGSSESSLNRFDTRLSTGHLADAPAILQVHAHLLCLHPGSDSPPRRAARFLHGCAPAAAVPSVSSRQLRPGEVIPAKRAVHASGGGFAARHYKYKDGPTRPDVIRWIVNVCCWHWFFQ